MSKEKPINSEQFELDEALEQIKSVDTSKYKSHPMVEKLLACQIEELKKERLELGLKLAEYSSENNI